MSYNNREISRPNFYSTGNEIATKVVNRSIETNLSFETIARVLESDERQNTCKISFLNEYGVRDTRDNVPVSLTSNYQDTFPVPGSVVIIRMVNREPIIIGEYIEDINEFYKARRITTDRTPDGDSSIGYMILPGGGLD